MKAFLKKVYEKLFVLRARTVRIDTAALLRDLSGPDGKLLQQFYAMNHRWVALLEERNRRVAVETYDFIDKHMPNAMFTLNQMTVIESKKNLITTVTGSVLDLGVYKGGSTRSLARIFPNHTIHGFDSFEGLPDDWSHVPKGTFGDVAGRLPSVPGNVRLHKGWFDDTLPVWLKENSNQPIALLRIDCDIYSSTKTIFTVLKPLIVKGTWIVFDELIGYRGWKDHEYKAFMEFIEESGFEFEYVAFGLTYTMGYIK